MFAMGREGTLPRWFGRTHRSYKTPANATISIAALATVVAVLVGFGWPHEALGGGPFTVFGLLASIGGLAVIVVYLALCVGGLVDSLTRAAWLAAAIAGMVGIGVPGLRRRLNMPMVGTGLLGGMLLAVAALVAAARAW